MQKCLLSALFPVAQLPPDNVLQSDLQLWARFRQQHVEAIKALHSGEPAGVARSLQYDLDAEIAPNVWLLQDSAVGHSCCTRTALIVQYAVSMLRRGKKVLVISADDKEIERGFANLQHDIDPNDATLDHVQILALRSLIPYRTSGNADNNTMMMPDHYLGGDHNNNGNHQNAQPRNTAAARRWTQTVASEVMNAIGEMDAIAIDTIGLECHSSNANDERFHVLRLLSVVASCVARRQQQETARYFAGLHDHMQEKAARNNGLVPANIETTYMAEHPPPLITALVAVSNKSTGIDWRRQQHPPVVPSILGHLRGVVSHVVCLASHVDVTIHELSALALDEQQLQEQNQRRQQQPVRYMRLRIDCPGNGPHTGMAMATGAGSSVFNFITAAVPPPGGARRGSSVNSANTSGSNSPTRNLLGGGGGGSPNRRPRGGAAAADADSEVPAIAVAEVRQWH